MTETKWIIDVDSEKEAKTSIRKKEAAIANGRAITTMYPRIHFTARFQGELQN